MKKKLKELLNGLGLVAAAVAMMIVAIALIFIITSIRQAIFK